MAANIIFCPGPDLSFLDLSPFGFIIIINDVLWSPAVEVTVYSLSYDAASFVPVTKALNMRYFNGLQFRANSMNGGTMRSVQ